MDWDTIIKHLELPWKSKWLIYNPNIGWDHVINSMDIINWDMFDVTSLSNCIKAIDLDIIDIFDYSNWNWRKISQYYIITLEIFDKHWDYKKLSLNKNLTWNIIEKYIDNDWDWMSLSRNPYLTWKIVNKYPNKSWNWFLLSRNPMNKIDSIISIQKWWRKVSIRQKKRHWKYLHINIRSLPNIGIDYFRALESFNNLQKDQYIK